MLMTQPLTLSVKMSAITLDPLALDNLASEYYGQVAVPSGDQDESETQIVEFMDHTHNDLKTKVLASENIKAFQSALDSFLIKS
jgi:hypothetical protein